jgi:antitoxin PrlF
MSTATVTTKGQITIPADVRRRLGLESGDRVEFVEMDGGFAIKPAIDDVRSLKGLLRKPAKPVSITEMNAVIRARGGGTR